MTSATRIINGKILTPGGMVDGSLLVKDGLIAGIDLQQQERVDAVEIDAAGRYVSPGFIDLHVHGGGGCDFMDATVPAFLKIAETHAQYGTTAMMPTTLTSTREEMIRTLEVYEDANSVNHNGAAFLGMHLEGPYFAMSQRGAQHPKYIRMPDPAEYKEILSRSSAVRRWSIAPELPGAIEMGRYLCSKNILPSMAHTEALYDEAKEAYGNGYSLVTHLYSGMQGVIRKNAFRYAGLVEAAFLIEGLDIEIIADGIHLPAPLLQLICKMKDPSRIALITDAMRAAGTNDTESMLGHPRDGMPVIIEDGVAKLPDRSAFAGSIATADQLIRTMTELASLPLLAAVQMLTATPARILGLSAQKGSLEKGMDADIVIFDENIRVDLAMVKGKVIYERSPQAAL